MKYYTKLFVDREVRVSLPEADLNTNLANSRCICLKLEFKKRDRVVRIATSPSRLFRDSMCARVTGCLGLTLV